MTKVESQHALHILPRIRQSQHSYGIASRCLCKRPKKYMFTFRGNKYNDTEGAMAKVEVN